MTTHNDETPPQTDSDDILHIGQVMARWRVLVGRRLIGRLAIQNVAPGLELTYLDVLSAVNRVEKTGEPTVGTIAEVLYLDPSRASRITAEMVTKGVLRRKASQADARRTILAITALGQRLITEIQAQKQAVIKDIIADWPDADIENFARLFDKFASGFEQRFMARNDTNKE